MVLRLHNVSVCLQGKKHSKTLVKDVSLTAHAHQISTIIGANGAGKSSLIKTVTGDMPITQGSIEFNGDVIDPHINNPQRARALAVLPQLSLLNFPYTAAEVVSLGRIPHASGNVVDTEIIAECLTMVDMTELADQQYPQLSGGEKQRIQIARVLAQIWRASDAAQTRLLILDEPTNALDLGHQQLLMNFLRTFATQQDVAILMVLHDLNIAASYSDQLFAMQNAQLALTGSVEQVLTPANIKQLFGIDANVIQHPKTNRPVVLVS